MSNTQRQIWHYVFSVKVSKTGKIWWKVADCVFHFFIETQIVVANSHSPLPLNTSQPLATSLMWRLANWRGKSKSRSPRLESNQTKLLASLYSKNLLVFKKLLIHILGLSSTCNHMTMNTLYNSDTSTLEQRFYAKNILPAQGFEPTTFWAVAFCRDTCPFT